MTKDQYDLAKKLFDEKRKLIEELNIWEEELTSSKKLAYLQKWNNDHAAKFENTVSDALFQSFRTSAMNAIQIRVAEIEKEFSGI